MVIKPWCRYFTGKFIRAWPAITLHAPDMNEKLWDKKRKLEDAYVAGEWLFSGNWFFASITGAQGQVVVPQDFFDIYCGNSGIFSPVYMGNRNIIKLRRGGQIYE